MRRIPKELKECLKALGVPLDIEFEMLSFTEKKRFRICTDVIRGYSVIVDASMYDRDTLSKIISYLDKKGAKYTVINI